MKFMVGKKLSEEVVVLEGEHAGIYETNMDFESEDYEVFGFQDAQVVFETPENPGAIDEIKASFDPVEKLYKKCFQKQGMKFNAKVIDDVRLPSGKTAREEVNELRIKAKSKKAIEKLSEKTK